MREAEEYLKMIDCPNTTFILDGYLTTLATILEEYAEAKLKNHSALSDVSDILPKFLYHGNDGNLYFKYQEDTDLTEMWNDYKNSCR
jgi:hypothetical protein